MVLIVLLVALFIGVVVWLARTARRRPSGSHPGISSDGGLPIWMMTSPGESSSHRADAAPHAPCHHSHGDNVDTGGHDCSTSDGGGGGGCDGGGGGGSD